jgi:hypothetical protein
MVDYLLAKMGIFRPINLQQFDVEKFLEKEGYLSVRFWDAVGN